MGDEMASREIIEKYYADIWNITQVLASLVNSYRLLIGGAEELNTITLAHSDDVKDALHLVRELGEIIDEVIEVLEKSSDYYFKYCKMKSQILNAKIEQNIIQTEIDQELDFLNSKREEENSDEKRQE